jgi:hypothetical protein
LAEDAARGGEHHAGAHQDHPGSGLAGRPGRSLPVPAELGEEVTAGRGRLVDDGVVGVAVVAGRRPIDHQRDAALGDRPGQHVGRLDAAVPDQLLVRAGPAPVADTGAAQVDDRVDPVQRSGVHPAGRRVPPTLVLGGRLPPHQPHHLVARLPQRGQERRPEEAGRSRGRDPHAAIVPDRHRVR